jgi:hypothetical protein
MAVTFTATTVSNPTGAQGSYPIREVAGHEGGVADLQTYVSRSFRNQTGAAIPFGALVMTDTTSGYDALAVKLATATSQIQGMVVSSQVTEGTTLGSAYTPVPTPYYSDGRMGYPDKETVNVVSKGVVWVYTVEAIALTDAVRFYKADYSGTTTGAYLGRFGKTAVSTKTIAVSGARWLSKTTGAGLVLLELDIPGQTYTAD